MIENWIRDPVGVLALQGELKPIEVPILMIRVREALEKSTYRSVVCDLHGLAVAHRPALAALPIALTFSGGWPCNSLRLASPAHEVGEQLRTMGMRQFLPVHADLAEALSAAEREPILRCQELHLAPRPSSARRARLAVERHWPRHDPQAKLEAAMVAGELVTNAVEHVGRPLVLALGFSTREALIAVTDPSRDAPVLRRTGSHRVGRGLRLVEALSREWGTRWVAPTGKTVWARLRPPVRLPAPRSSEA